jgi:hypothetical protein
MRIKMTFYRESPPLVAANVESGFVWMRRIMVCLPLLAVLCQCSTETQINYRLTVKIRVDDTVRVGSGVVRTVWRSQPLPNFAQGTRWTVSVSGEAIVVDLAPRGMLFVTLTGPPLAKAGDPAGGTYYPPDPERIALQAFGAGSVGTMTPEALASLAVRTGEIPVPPAGLPMLLRFADPRDPATVHQVDPRDLPASFGAGVGFAAASVAITNDPPTTGIDKVLPWLAALRGKFLSGKRTATLGLPESTPVTVFQQGLDQP